MHAIARAQATAGDIPLALATTEEISNPYAEALTGCWVAYAAVGAVPPDEMDQLLSGASALIDAVEDVRDRASLLACIAAAYARAGETNRAGALVQQALTDTAETPSDYQRALIQAFMVRPLRLAGDYDDAVTLAVAAMETARDRENAFDAVRLFTTLASAFRD